MGFNNNSSSSSSSSDNVAAKKSSEGRTGLFFFATLYTFFFVGAIFGWGPMQRMLEASGAFASVCPAGTTKFPCPQQSTTIINVQFIATTTNTLTPFIGQAIDVYGAPAVATYFMSPCAVVGAGVLVVASYLAVDKLYYVGFCLLGLATFSGSLLSVQVGLYFTGKTQVRAIMLLNTLFDAGSVSYLLLWAILEYFKLSFSMITVIYFVLAIIQYGGGIYYWNTAEPEHGAGYIEDDDDGLPADEASKLLSVHEGEGPTEKFEIHLTKAEVRESLREFQAAHMDNVDEIQRTMKSYRGSDGSIRSLHSPSVSRAGGDWIPLVGSGDHYVLISERSTMGQLLSPAFIMLTLFFSINMISSNWSLATAADFLADLGDNGIYLSIFTLMQPASIVCLPLVDAVVHNLGFGVAFQCVNVITFVYIGIKLVSTDLNVQIIHFFSVAAVRCFLFAVVFSFLPRLLSPKVVGKGTGFLYMIGGVFCFINIPLNQFSLHAGFFLPNLMYLFLTIPTTFMAAYVQMVIGKEKKEVARREAAKAIN